MTSGSAPAPDGPLRFASPDDPGIRRVRAGKGFRYEAADGRRVADDAELVRFRRLAIPPAWTEVWISPDPNGHLQAVGRDARGRRQYRYHPGFRARRDRDKYARLIRFGDVLPRIRRRVRQDLASRGLSREKVVAAVVALLDSTHLRVGNAEYARLNRSFGLSTLRNRHAKVAGASLRFRFRGKGGRMEERRVVDRRLAAIVRRCQELPGQALFQYPDPDDPELTHAISSEDVNAYIREAAGSDDFSAKDFRTWAATLLAFRAMDAAKAAITMTAEALGDTPTVARNAYIHPAVLAEIDAAAATKRAAAATKGAAAATKGAAAARKHAPAGSRAAQAGVEPAPPSTQPTRRDELALLRFLRARRRRDVASARAASPTGATRPQSGARGDDVRSGRRAA